MGLIYYMGLLHTIWSGLRRNGPFKMQTTTFLLAANADYDPLFGVNWGVACILCQISCFRTFTYKDVRQAVLIKHVQADLQALANVKYFDIRLSQSNNPNVIHLFPINSS